VKTLRVWVKALSGGNPFFLLSLFIFFICLSAAAVHGVKLMGERERHLVES
jgi:hypothetical protein